MGNAAEYAEAVGFGLLSHAPLFAAWIVGIVLALARWRRHPRVSLFATLGLCGLLVLAIVTTATSILLPMKLHQAGMGVAKMGVILGAIGLASSALTAGCWVLILIAILGDRSPGK